MKALQSWEEASVFLRSWKKKKSKFTENRKRKSINLSMGIR